MAITEAARLFIPTTRAVLERLQAEIWQALFANDLGILCSPFTDDAMPRAEDATHFLRWTLSATLDWFDVSSTLIFDALLDSVGVAKVYTFNPPWPPPSEDARRYLSRLVRIDALDLGMLLVAPDAESTLQYPECRYVAQEFFLTVDDILRLERQGFDTPDADELGDSQVLTERKRLELEREGERVVEFRPDSIPFVESYERFTLEGDIGDEDLIVSWFPDALVQGSASAQGRIAGARRLTTVFPQDDRPRRPFHPITFWPQPRQWRGLNIPDRLESMQDLINRLHEQLVNYGEVCMLPYAFVNTFVTGEIPDLRTVRPGSTVPIDDISGVQFAPTRSLNRHFAEQIQLAQANVERDTNVTDFNLGRQGSSATAPRTASATMALLAQTRKSYGMLVRRCAKQFSSLLQFHFRLWQAILPDDTYVQMFPPSASLSVVENAASPASIDLGRPTQPGETSALWERLFAKKPLADVARNTPSVRVALPIAKEALSGLFDVRIEVNPEEEFDRQTLTALFQMTAPMIQDFPLGIRTLLKRIWTIFDQPGFDEVYPEEIALLQTQQRLTAMQVQLATFQAQLDQIEQQKAQQQLALLQQHAQHFQQTGQISPELAAFAQQHVPAPTPGGAAPGANGQLAAGLPTQEGGI